MPARRKTDASTKYTDLDATSTSTPHPIRIRNTPGKSSHRIEKIEKPRRTSPRLQEKLRKTLASFGPPREPSNKNDDQTGTRKPIQGRDGEKELSSPPENTKKERTAKPTTMSVSAVSNKPQPLTANNLKKHTLREGYVDTLELISPEANEDFRSEGSETSSSSLINTETAYLLTGDKKHASEIAQWLTYKADTSGLSTPVGGFSLI